MRSQVSARINASTPPAITTEPEREHVGDLRSAAVEEQVLGIRRLRWAVVPRCGIRNSWWLASGGGNGNRYMTDVASTCPLGPRTTPSVPVDPPVPPATASSGSHTTWLDRVHNRASRGRTSHRVQDAAACACRNGPGLVRRARSPRSARPATATAIAYGSPHRFPPARSLGSNLRVPSKRTASAAAPTALNGSYPSRRCTGADRCAEQLGQSAAVRPARRASAALVVLADRKPEVIRAALRT
jgi:hypothetical protein